MPQVTNRFGQTFHDTFLDFGSNRRLLKEQVIDHTLT